MHFLNRFFKLEEINGAGRCSTYLYRWTIFKCRWFNVYLHRFVGDDWSRDLHDHPKRFVSVGLSGGYIKETPTGESAFHAPWIRTFPAEHIHRVRMIDGKKCLTMVIVFSATRPWGFYHKGAWIHWREYVKGKFAHVADSMKNCPDEGEEK